MVSRKFDGAIIDCGGYNSLTNLAPSTANGEPVVHEQIQYVTDSDLPTATWVNATSVQVGIGKAVCRSIVDPNSYRLWQRPVNIAPITATLPSGLSANQDIYLYLATNGTGDTASDTAFFSTTLPANNTPTGFSWIRLIAAFKLNSSAQLVNFQMTKGGWITRQFDTASMIAGASWASTVIPGVPTGLPVEFYGVAGSGLPVSGGQYSIKLSGANPNTFGISPPATSDGHWSTFFGGDMGALFFQSGSDVRYMETAINSNFVIQNGEIWHYKNGSDYIGANNRPTIQPRKYKTITTFNGVY